MENPEHVLMELNSLEKEPQDCLPDVLEKYLVFVAKTGNTVFAWPKIKPAVRVKLESIIEDFNLAMPEDQIPRMPNVDAFNFAEMKQRIFEQLESYSGIPFTMQRLCELLTQPKRHYKRVDKFMRGLEKVMLVVSTVEPFALGGEEAELTREKSENGAQLSMGRLLEGEEGRNGTRGHQEEDEDMSLESPSKRIRLSSAEDEAGPCDSQDGVSQLPKPMVLEENGDSRNDGAVCAGPPSPGSAEAMTESSSSSSSEAMMDIDAECTSSEARLLTCSASTEAGPASTSSDASRVPHQNGQVNMDKGCDSNSGVTTSIVQPGEERSNNVSMEEVEEVKAANSTEPSSSEGVARMDLQCEAREGTQESGVPDCSSSDQATIAGRDSVSPTNSEAEPAGDQEQPVRENGVEVGEGEVEVNNQDEEVSPPASVQSSEEAKVQEGKVVGNESGAADSSDQVQVASTEGAGDKEEETSPDQSGTS